MSRKPDTSRTLLEALSASAQSARWAEFVAIYRPYMAQYMAAHFPGLEADDVIQETLIALVKALEHYRYAPEDKGCFHCYLIGILRNKALRLLRENGRYAEVLSRVREEGWADAKPSDENEFRQAVFEIAWREFERDESVASRTKMVFRQVAMKGEPPEKVAEAYGLTRHAVDLVKARVLARLRETARRLENAW